MRDLRISEVRWIPAPSKYKGAGLLGWTSCTVDDALGIAVAVRRTLDGRLTLAFPERRDSDGQPHDIAWPVNQEAREAFETQVFDALQRQGNLPPRSDVTPNRTSGLEERRP